MMPYVLLYTVMCIHMSSSTSKNMYLTHAHLSLGFLESSQNKQTSLRPMTSVFKGKYSDKKISLFTICCLQKISFMKLKKYKNS